MLIIIIIKSFSRLSVDVTSPECLRYAVLNLLSSGMRLMSFFDGTSVLMIWMIWLMLVSAEVKVAEISRFRIPTKRFNVNTPFAIFLESTFPPRIASATALASDAVKKTSGHVIVMPSALFLSAKREFFVMNGF